MEGRGISHRDDCSPRDIMCLLIENVLFFGCIRRLFRLFFRSCRVLHHPVDPAEKRTLLQMKVKCNHDFTERVSFLNEEAFDGGMRSYLERGSAGK